MKLLTHIHIWKNIHDQINEFRKIHIPSPQISNIFLQGECVLLRGGGLVTKSCLTLAAPRTVACQASLPIGLSRQEYWLEWVAISFSRGPYWPRTWTQVSGIAGRFFINWAILCRCVYTHTHTHINIYK